MTRLLTGPCGPVDHHVAGAFRWALLPSMVPGCGLRTHLFGPSSRIESNCESQLWGDTLDWRAHPRTPGGGGFWRLVLILSIAGCPPPERGWGLCRLLLPSLHPWKEWQGREGAMSILYKKGSMGPEFPQRSQCTLRDHAGAGPASPLHLPLPPSAHTLGFSAGWGTCLSWAGLHQESTPHRAGAQNTKD